MTRPDLTLSREFEAALVWWRSAGVDCDFVDDATAWLADTPAEIVSPAKGSGHGPPASAAAASSSGHDSVSEPRAAIAAAPAAVAEIARRNLLGDSPPPDLAAFRQWWCTGDWPAGSQAFPRIAPRGAAGAALMVLVPQPEEADRERLLEGPQGRLLANMLGAMGLEESAVYLAAALPCHTPMADLAGIAASGMDAVTAHHVALVRPVRLLVLGTGLAAMIGMTPDRPLREINHAGVKVPVLMSETLEALMEMPRLKARFWRRWIEWSAPQ